MGMLEREHIDNDGLNNITQKGTYILLVEKRWVSVESFEGKEAFQGLSFIICCDASAHRQIFLLATSGRALLAGADWILLKLLLVMAHLSLLHFVMFHRQFLIYILLSRIRAATIIGSRCLR